MVLDRHNEWASPQQNHHELDLQSQSQTNVVFVSPIKAIYHLLDIRESNQKVYLVHKDALYL
ncbi:hypothetical protein D3C86_1430590 [compost metagenome]